MRRDFVSAIIFLAVGCAIVALPKSPTNHSLPSPVSAAMATLPPHQTSAMASISAVEVTPTPTPIPTTQPTIQALSAAPLGSKEDWMRAAGIPESVWHYVGFIVSHESSWNPNAVNPSSGACGLGQQLPCGKWAGAWNDPVAALVAMNSYVTRYGGWAGAHAFWVQNRWY